MVIDGQSDPAEVMATSTPPTACAACGAPHARRFCGDCGQRRLEGRHTVRGLVRGAFTRVFNLERGLIHTVVQLTRDPGKVIRDQIGGRSVVYVHPFTYLVLAFALFALVNRWFPLVMGGDDRVLLGLVVFFLAMVSRVIFLGSGLNMAEHLILNVLLLSHATLLLLPAVILTHFAPAPTPALVTLISGFAVAFAYFVWGYSRVFSRRGAWAAAGAVGVVLGGLVLWMVAMLALVRVSRAFIGG